MLEEKQNWEKRKELAIPDESDWGNYLADLDAEWAHRMFIGKSNEETQPYFRNNPIEAASDLAFMPEIPFRYYMLGFRDCVMAKKFEPCNDSDAASCFLGLVAKKLESNPRFIVPIMPALLPSIDYVAKNQEAYQADESIYGSFLQLYERILALYAESKGRYRRP